MPYNRSLLPYNRSLLPYNRSLLPYNTALSPALRLRYARISRSLLPSNRSLLPSNRSLLPYNRSLLTLAHTHTSAHLRIRIPQPRDRAIRSSSWSPNTTSLNNMAGLCPWVPPRGTTMIGWATAPRRRMMIRPRTWPTPLTRKSQSQSRVAPICGSRVW